MSPPNTTGQTFDHGNRPLRRIYAVTRPGVPSLLFSNKREAFAFATACSGSVHVQQLDVAKQILWGRVVYRGGVEEEYGTHATASASRSESKS